VFELSLAEIDKFTDQSVVFVELLFQEIQFITIASLVSELYVIDVHTGGVLSSTFMLISKVLHKLLFELQSVAQDNTSTEYDFVTSNVLLQLSLASYHHKQ